MSFARSTAGTVPKGIIERRRNAMHGIIYIIGLIVVVMVILSFVGLA
ncbi:hypothetical protein [Bauldia litoralis]|nr:hypothetical protein [Bauldia litoralis]